MEGRIDSSCLSIMILNVVIPIIFGIISIIVIRVFYVIYRSSQPQRVTSTRQPLSTLIVMGSGGHTAEMLNLMSVLQKNRFKPRYYIAAATDHMSLQKAQAFENSLLDQLSLAKEIFLPTSNAQHTQWGSEKWMSKNYERFQHLFRHSSAGFSCFRKVLKKLEMPNTCRYIGVERLVNRI